MIFKTTLKDINSTAIAIDKIGSMTLPNYIDIGTAIDGLSAKQAALVLSTRNLSQAELEEVVIQNELIKKYGANELVRYGLLSANSSLLASEKAVSAEKLKESIQQSALNKEKAQEFIQKRLIVTANGEESASTVMLNKALMDEAVRRGILSEEKAEEILSTYGIVTADVAEIGSKKALATATWKLVESQIALLASNPVTWIVLGLVALVGVLDLVTTSTAEYNKELSGLRDNLENVKSECSELESELKSCNDELITTQERLKELEKIKSPTFAEKEEYNNLIATNNELQRKIDLLELEQKVKNSEKNKAFIDTMQKDVNDNKEYWLEVDTGIIMKGDSMWAQIGGIHAHDSTEADYIEQQLATRRYLSDELSKAETKEDKTKIQNRIDKIDSYLQEKSSEWNKDSEGINYIKNPTSEDDKAVNEWLDYIADFQDRMAIAMSTKDAEKNAQYKTNTFNRLVDNWEFDDTVQELQDLGKEGKVTAEMLDDPKYDEFINKLVFLGVIDSADNLDAVALAFNSVAITAKNAAEAEKEYAKSSTLNDPLSIIDTIDQLNTHLKPAMDSLKSAWQDIFTKDGFALNSIDILSTCDNIKSKLDELNKIDGVTVDYSAYEDFVKVLRNTESTEQDVKDATDSLATSITQAALSGTEDFETMKAVLEDLGVVNSEIVAFDALISNTKALKEANLDLANATYADIVQFADEHVAAENLAQAINMLTQQKMLNVMENMDTSTEVANMISLAKKAGMTSDVIENLTELEIIYQEVAKGTLSEHMLSKKLDRANELKQLIEDGITKVDYTPEVDFSGVAKSVSSAASSAAKSFTDLLDKELNVLDKKMEAGYIDFNDYMQSRLALIEDYYRQGRLSADEYYSYLEQHYDKQLSYMDKAINAVTRRIDKEIDGLEKQKDEIEHNYQLQIDYLNEQKTLLEDANKERQRQINLQKALYELERAKNQRTMLIYSEDKGLHYVADDTAIKDAQQEVEDAEFDIQIADIESSISKLEEARDTETAAIDAMIEKLQEYKEQWNDITSAYEEEQEDLIAAQIFGQEWESEILDGRLDTLNRFKDDYIAIQQAMVDAAYQAAQAIANGDNTTIGDTSKGKTGSSTGGRPEHGWEVVDESDPSKSRQFDKAKNQKAKAEAEAYLRAENKKRAASIGIDVSKDDPNDPNPEWLRLFNNSNVPGFYMKKYHTGLQHGPVKQHSFDEDFKLIRRVGLGAEEVPAILKVGEAVATPEQIHNLADSIRQSAMPNLLISPSSNYPFAQNLDRIASSPTQQVINQNITLNCPNVTNHSGVEYIQRELGHLSLRALQEFRKR